MEWLQLVILLRNTWLVVNILRDIGILHFIVLDHLLHMLILTALIHVHNL